MVFTQTRILSSIYELETSTGIISRTTRDAGIMYLYSYINMSYKSTNKPENQGNLRKPINCGA